MPSSVAQSSSKSGEWDHGLCDGGCGSCMAAWCCPSFFFGRTNKRMEKFPETEDPGFWSCTRTCWALHFGRWPVIMKLRWDIRERFGIEHPDGCNDCLEVWCCWPCALSQMDKELKSRAAKEQAKKTTTTTKYASEQPQMAYARPPQITEKMVPLATVATPATAVVAPVATVAVPAPAVTVATPAPAVAAPAIAVVAPAVVPAAPATSKEDRAKETAARVAAAPIIVVESPTPARRTSVPLIKTETTASDKAAPVRRTTEPLAAEKVVVVAPPAAAATVVASEKAKPAAAVESTKTETEKAEREKTEHEKAEHEKAEKEKAEHEKAEKEKSPPPAATTTTVVEHQPPPAETVKVTEKPTEPTDKPAASP